MHRRNFSLRPDSRNSVDDAINIDGKLLLFARLLYRSNQTSLRSVFVAIAGFLIATSGAFPAAGQSSSPTGPLMSAQRILLPTRGIAPTDFRIEVRHERLTQFGDLPMRVLVTPTNVTFQEDRELAIRLTFDPKSVTPSGLAANYQFTVNIAAGDSSVDQTFYLPKWFMRGNMRLSVLEAGQPLVGYTDTQAATWYDNSDDPYDSDWLETIWLDSAVARFGWIASPGSKPLISVSQASDLDDVRLLLLSVVPELSFAEDLTTVTNLPAVLKTYGDMAGFRYRTIEELPTQWQGMQQCHVWIADWATWEAIEKDHPQIALALRQYVRCGGALWLVNAPPQETVAERFNIKLKPAVVEGQDDLSLESLSGDRGLDALAANALAALTGSTSTRDRKRLFFPLPDFTQIINATYRRSPLYLRQGLVNSLQSRLDPGNALWQRNTSLLRSNLGTDVLASEINTIDVGPGIIVSCSHPDSAKGSYFQWLQMQQESGARLSSVINRGVDPIAGDGRFWNWTIPGVAQPPVYTFIGLLFLFVILVGPLAYRKLTQLGRGYLMFFVAPVLAAGTTLVLFVYGVVADGLGTQARIRQVTWLCEQDGGAVQYWRSTYYAGFRPSDGLSFPPSTRVEPYRTGEYESWYMMNVGDESTQGTITLNDQGVRLSSGFFPSRQQRQFVAYRPLQRAGGLTFTIDQDSGVANVTSGFDYDLRELVLRDSSGAYWSCEVLAAGSTQRLSLIDPADTAGVLSELYMRQMPVSPPGIIRGGRRGRSNLDLVAGLAASGPFVNTPVSMRAASGESQIDWWLRETLQTRSELPALMFIAVADVSEACIASPGARLVESIHYVIGDVQ